MEDRSSRPHRLRTALTPKDIERILFERKQFKHPWTNGMVERFNRNIKDGVLKNYRFQSILEMEQKTIEFVNRYNLEKRLKSLNYQTPNDFLKEKENVSIQRIVI